VELSNVAPESIYEIAVVLTIFVAIGCYMMARMALSPLLLATLEHRFTGNERHFQSESFIRSKEFLSNASPFEQIA
jgi:hypothetical protein